MDKIRGFAESHPFWFVICLAVFQPLIAMPFVLALKVFGLALVPLQLAIPAAQSVIILWLIVALGWTRRCGLVGPVRNAHLLIYPALAHFLPALIYGTVPIAPGWALFYFLALLATGISEEGFARGVAVPLLASFGKWAAVLIAAAIFSAGHVTNIFIEDFSVLEWVDKFSTTFGFGVLYGALFLRTGSLLPLIFLHTVEDWIYLTSGTAGPFVAVPIDIRIHLMIALANLGVGLYLTSGVRDTDLQGVGQVAISGARTS